MRTLSFPFIVFVLFSGFPKVGQAAGVGGAILSLSSHLKRSMADIEINKGLENMGINPDSLDGFPLEIFKNSWDNPLKLITDYDFSLDDILGSDIHRIFFFSRLNLSDKDQMDELFYRLMPAVDSSSHYGREMDSFELKFPSNSWDEFIEAMEEVRLAGYSEITKADIESAFITHLGSFSYSVGSSDKQMRFVMNVYPEDSWVVNTAHPIGTFFRFAVGSGTEISEILTNPHFKLDPSGSAIQEVVKIALSYSSRVDEILSSREVVLKIWEAVKTDPSILNDGSRKVNQKTFRKYIVRSLKKSGYPATQEGIARAIQENPFLLAVFEALKEDTMLAEMFEDILVNNFSGGSSKQAVRQHMAWHLYRDRAPNEVESLVEENPIFTVFNRIFSETDYPRDVRNFIPLSHYMNNLNR